MNKGDIELWKNILKSYYYLKKKEKFINQQIIRLDMKIEREEHNAIRGMNYESSTAVVGDGCSVHCTKNSRPLHYLVDKQIQLNNELENLIEQYRTFDEVFKITERYRSLSVESQIIINNIFQREMTLDEVSRIEGEEVSKTTVKNRLDKALKEMIEAC